MYVRNLPFGITDEDVYDIFGKYGAIRQIRVGNTRSTKGTAYVVYEDIYVGKPRVEQDAISYDVTPHECRLRDMTQVLGARCGRRAAGGALRAAQ